MSGLLFLYSLVFAIAIVIMVAILYDCGFNVKIRACVSCIGTVLFLILLFMSFRYENITHMTTSFKYDRVRYIDYALNDKSITDAAEMTDFEKAHIIYQRDYTSSCVQKLIYRTIIIAYNDEDYISYTYKALTKEREEKNEK